METAPLAGSCQRQEADWWQRRKVIFGGQRFRTRLRAHQVPLSGLAEHPKHLKMLEEWMKSYRPEELFDASGKELFRHAGFYSKEEILAKWKEFNVERKEGNDV